MKKVFLSLATIAFVAVGSLTMTSCGDDSTLNQEPENPILTQNFVKYDGKYYKLDTNTFQIQSNAAKTEPAFLKASYEDGGKEYVVSEWVAAAWLSNGNEDPEYEVQVYFDVEAKSTTNSSGVEVYSLQTPGQAENVFPYRITVIKDGVKVSDTEYAYGKIKVNFNVFNLGDDSLTVDYDGSNTVNDATFDYNGASGLTLTQWYIPQAKKSSTTKKTLHNLEFLSAKKAINNYNILK